MNRDQLTALFAEKKNSYVDLLERVKHETKSEQWAMGAVGPYSLEPYSCELLGFAPGKILKNSSKPSKPSKNRHRYFLDRESRVIRAIAYDFQTEKSNEWSHSDEFFVYYTNHTIEFKFNSVPESARSARLQRLTYAATNMGAITNTFSLTRSDEYVETDYVYKGDKVVHITQRMWYESLFVRNFDLKHEGDRVTVIEQKADGSFNQIYPALK